MREEIESIMKINESLKRLIKVAKVELAIDDEQRKVIGESIKELLALLREAEKTIWCYPPADIYFIGKTFGRVEAIYALIGKEIFKEVGE